jgi:DNA-binding transcriptional ArsR family regulator
MARSSKPEPARPSERAFDRASALFRAVGDVSRLRLLHDLGDDELSVTDLAAREGTKLSTLSQQLRLLHAQHIVARRRDGKHIYYRLADAHVKQMIGAALDHAEHDH